MLGSLGIAVYRSQFAAAMPVGVSPEVAQIALETLGGAFVAAGQLPDQIGAALLDTARIAFVQGLQLNAVLGVIGFIGLAILVGTLLRHLQIHGDAESEPEVVVDGTLASNLEVEPALEPVPVVPEKM
jgi:DHA2 family multidrug resistance protein-like MFS transporter